MSISGFWIAPEVATYSRHQALVSMYVASRLQGYVMWIVLALKCLNFKALQRRWLFECFYSKWCNTNGLCLTLLLLCKSFWCTIFLYWFCVSFVLKKLRHLDMVVVRLWQPVYLFLAKIARSGDLIQTLWSYLSYWSIVFLLYNRETASYAGYRETTKNNTLVTAMFVILDACCRCHSWTWWVKLDTLERSVHDVLMQGQRNQTHVDAGEASRSSACKFE